MSHTYVPTVPRTRRLVVAAALLAAVAAGAVGAELADRFTDAPGVSAPSTIDADPFAIERARADRYVDWLEERARAAEVEMQR